MWKRAGEIALMKVCIFVLVNNYFGGVHKFDFDEKYTWIVMKTIGDSYDYDDADEVDDYDHLKEIGDRSDGDAAAAAADGDDGNNDDDYYADDDVDD